MQVYLGDEFVGDLGINDKNVGNTTFTHVWSMISAPPLNTYIDPYDIDMSVATSFQKVTMNVGFRSLTLSEMDIAKSRDQHFIKNQLAAAGAPPLSSLIQQNDPARGERLFRWRVLQVTPQTLEQIFDLNEFTPADTEPDPDY